ncbi:MAG: calcium/sodium antiporter [Cellulosilyticaceae bacterium]
MEYILILVGFILLIKGADYFVDGASSIAKTFRIPTLIIGLTIVAFGTSAPEAAVSVTSALQGQNEIAVGNIVGSNIFNLLLVVGIAAFICPLKVKKSIIVKEFPFTLLSGFVLLVLAQDIIFQGATANILTRADGIMLLVLFGIFMYYLIELALTTRTEVNEEDDIKPMPIGKSVLLSVGGVVAIILGGKMVVDSASTIALAWGMSQSLVGLTIIAIGTSLPELVTSIVAARKGESDIALGNVIGSCIFNVFFILGMSATIHPIAVSTEVFTDMTIMLIVTIVTYIFAITKKNINKIEGIILVLTYVAYMTFIIMRN